MATAVLRCNAFCHQVVNPNISTSPTIFQNIKYKDIVEYIHEKITKKSGKHNNCNKNVLPYVQIIIKYLLTGNTSRSEYIILNESVKHLNLILADYEIDSILDKINKIFKLREKDTSSCQIIGFFTKNKPYGIEICLRMNKRDLIVRIFEYEYIDIYNSLPPIINVNIRLNWLEINIDDNCLNEKLIAKCRFCGDTIGFLHNVIEIFYCTQHGFLNNEDYIMYFAFDKNSTELLRVRKPNLNIKDYRICEFLNQPQGCNFGMGCIYAHNHLELNIWNFIYKNELSMQLLTSYQQKKNSPNYMKISNREAFDRCKTLHEIVNTSSVENLKKFIKHCKYDIFKEYDANGYSILHVAIKNNDYEMIKLFLDGCELAKCIETNDISNYDYDQFINHIANDNHTAFTLFLSGHTEFNENFEKIFNLFIQCREYDVKNALKICQDKKLDRFEQKILERLYDDEF